MTPTDMGPRGVPLGLVVRRAAIALVLERVEARVVLEFDGLRLGLTPAQARELARDLYELADGTEAPQ